jgi:hypothetical protein
MTVNPQLKVAPAELLQWFYEQLEYEREDVLLFVDPTTDVEIGVFRNTPAMREKFLAAGRPAPRRPLPGSPRPQPALHQRSPCQSPPTEEVSSSQAYGSEIEGEILTQLEQSIQANQPQPTVLEGLVHTTTSRNKTLIKRRAEKRAAKPGAVLHGRVAKPKSRVRQGQRKPRSAERVVPGSDDDASEEAEEEEEVELVDPWFRGLLPNGITPERARQAKMIRMAKAIAGPEAVEDWQGFMASWRDNGLLTSRPTSSNKKVAPKHLQTLPIEIVDFYYAYDRVRTFEIADSFKAITHRCRMVELWRIYAKAESVPFHIYLPLENGQRKQAQRKRFLFNTLHPELQGIEDVGKTPASKKQWGAFSDRLKHANRWHIIQQELGYGVLGLIPERVIPNRWVQKELGAAEFDVWIKAIKHFNPKCQAAAQNWTRTLDQALGGRQPSRRRRALEGVSPTTLKGFTDTTMLFCDEVGQSGDEMQGGEPPSSQLVTQSQSGEGFRSLFTGIEPGWGVSESIHFTDEQWAALGALDIRQIQDNTMLFSSYDRQGLEELEKDGEGIGE